MICFCYFRSIRFRRLVVALLLAGALLAGLAWPGLVRAAGITVTRGDDVIGTGDGCTLREAILNANGDNLSGSSDCTAGSGTDTIGFAADYTIILGSSLPALSGSLTIDGAGRSITISGNDAVPVFNIQAGAAVTLSHLAIINGSQVGGGGGITNDGTLVVNNSIISGNRASAIGGGIYSRISGTLTISNSTISDNIAVYSGGGIYNQSALTINNSTISGNRAEGGGGIGSYIHGTLVVNNSTFSGNQATKGNGGGIASTEPLTITNSTFSGNRAIYSGGGIASSGPLVLRNSILANSIEGGDCSGSPATNVNNLVEDGSCGAAYSGDPRLAPLGDYSGSTPTFALLPGSPAIDRGDSAACASINHLDQRGVVRPVGACDIGAFEGQGFSLALTGGNNQGARIHNIFSQPLSVSVSSAYGEPVGPGGVIDYIAPGSGASLSVSPLSATTTAAGEAGASVAANGVIGAYTVVATATGVISPVHFSLTNLPPDVLASSTSLSLNEPAGTGTFSLWLSSPPTASVTIDLSSADPGQCTVAPLTVTFTPGGWDQPQMITVTAVNDGLEDGDQVCTIQTSAAASADPAYNGRPVDDISVTVFDVRRFYLPFLAK